MEEIGEPINARTGKVIRDKGGRKEREEGLCQNGQFDMGGEDKIL